MTITELLKMPGVRVSCGYKWLILDSEEFVVFHQPYRAKKPRVEYRGTDLQQAIAILTAWR